ncbi:hypothetical protein GCM10009839_41850 [Catenulispora yoronensis]|uniref:Uncharacterized protein n=1 Tax=Catenulispora yoronensis TaxID=450799 RepID=A0ABN2UFL9_9ACTN
MQGQVAARAGAAATVNAVISAMKASTQERAWRRERGKGGMGFSFRLPISLWNGRPSGPPRGE